MKKILPSFLIAATASSALLLAQNIEIMPDALDLSLPQYSNISGCQPHMMMVSAKSFRKGIANSLGLSGKRVPSTEVTSQDYRATGVGLDAGRTEEKVTSVSSISSKSQVAVAAKMSKTSEKISEESFEGQDNNNNLESEEVLSVNKYLRDEIINNIYTECLAEVAKLTSNSSGVAIENDPLEAREWAEAMAAAEVSQGRAQRKLEEARRETLEARVYKEETQKNVEEATKVKGQLMNKTKQAEASANLAYRQACFAYADADCKAKGCAELLAEVRVGMTDAVLNAIKYRTTSQRAIAEAELKTKKEIEIQAIADFEAAKNVVLIQKLCVETAETALNSARKNAPKVDNASALKAFKEDQRVANSTRDKARAIEISAINCKKTTTTDLGFSKEIQAYSAAQDAWEKAVQVYEVLLKQAEEHDLDNKEVMDDYLNAQKKESQWKNLLNARTLQAEAQKQEGIAMAAKNQAEVAMSVDITGPEKAIFALNKVQLWQEAEQKRAEAEGIWAQTFVAYHTWYSQASEDIKHTYAVEFTNALNKQNYWRVLNFWYRATIADSEAIAARLQACHNNLSLSEKKGQWNTMKQKREQAIQAWRKTEEELNMLQNKATDRFKNEWNTMIEETINNKNLSAANFSWDNALMASGNASGIKNKLSEIAGISEGMRLEQEQEQRQKEKQAKEAWNQVIGTYRTYRDQSLERFQAGWNALLEEVVDSGNYATIAKYWDDAVNLDTVATEAAKKWVQTQSRQDVEVARQKKIEAGLAWNRAVEAYREKKNKAPERLKTAWNRSLELIEDNRNHAVATACWCEAVVPYLSINKSWFSYSKEHYAYQAEAAWKKVIQMYSDFCKQAPEGKKAEWDIPIQEAESKLEECQKLIAYREKQREEQAAMREAGRRRFY
ncbi:MAG: hypothetical protein A3F67_07100 [Verrucomicrobia bacterium RIFCSPHIGHO2_12_FULL_41_10]|nr:MAG: hypothetical protein A3F67_07100 [Verrucomicrobia bacterium RIFCSPHIGHO2_12_FULL_41_10]HLB34359.1 hypothetical protein [Chthoniobacterales bacterium]